jgi:hypothetical protein
MSTYRERREHRAEQLAEWAGKREAKAEAAYAQASTMADGIPFGQPILVDHYSAGRDRRYRERIAGTFERSFADADKARNMASRADGIRSQLAGAIYDDDPDAVEALQARLAKLEAQREGIKAHNREMRKPGACPHPADCDCRKAYPRECTKCDRHPYPAYHLQNIAGNITRTRQRIEQVQRRQARAERSEQSGGVLVETRDGWAVVTFAEKPARDVIDALKTAGFRWGKGSWHGHAAALPECVAAGA